ncbi:MAG: hypothetical protein IPN53_13770 [Comamonadaceae bacterium]|nr:hypothetical protein [Comamonadaceae bacterium]
MMTFTSHEAYFALLSPDKRDLLRSIQAEVEANVPGALQCVSYKMPAFKQERVFFYFAVFKKHIGIYPPVTQDVDLIQELAPYRGEKGNLSFPLAEPLPIELIGRVALALSREYARK